MAEERASKRPKTHDEASSSSAAPISEYEVFLSFRGPDIRNSFADHLYCNLKDAGIRTFLDNEELRVGKEIGPDLLRAIEQSTVSIPIFSRGYASSKWCLKELTQMVKCMNRNNGRHTICPIFYDVTPSDVKHQTGSYREAFLEHTGTFKESEVEEWKEALEQVAELKGWEKDKVADGREGEFIKIIVTEVCRMLKKSHVSLTDVVGMDHHIEEMTKKLDINSCNGVRIVGILGMGGIGKTTIAKFMYNQLCNHFQQQCTFLEDVKEKVLRKGCAELQKQLISAVLNRRENGIDIRNAFRHKKVLIVLDDVEDKSQLNGIIGDREYFGSGSRIIVTARNKKVFEEWEGDLIYEPSVMDIDESLLLFYKYAFKSNQPREGYEVISREVVSTAAGLPLSLVVIGSLLFNKEQTIWEAALQKLKEVPADDVQKRLKISYDTLKDNQKQMFLDIACHFIGEDKTNAIYMWEHCGFSPEFEGIDVLVSLSLITIEKLQYPGDVFRMHDHLRDLGRDIVKQENRSDPGQRSRVWSREEAREVLDNQSETKKVQTLSIKFDDSGRRFSDHDIKGMSKLRYFHLGSNPSNLEGDFNRLLPQLRWFRCRLTGIAVTNFCPRKLVILDLSLSDISDVHWEFLWKQMEQPLSNLKVLDLSCCRGLTKTPDFSKFRNLERLILEYCENLTEIGSSVKHLTRLTYLNAKTCPSLRKLPPEFGSLAALQDVFLDCPIFWEGQGISELPESIGLLTQLRCLSLKTCRSLVKIPQSFGNLKSLVELKCSGCGLEGELPEGIQSLSSLRSLVLKGTKISGLPKDISRMSHLETLNLGYCYNLWLLTEGLKLPLSLTRLVIPFTKTILDSLRSLVNLRDLKFVDDVRYECESKLKSWYDVRCCCELDESDSESEGDVETIYMPSNLEVLELWGFYDHEMIRNCRHLLVMKFDSSSRLNRLVIRNFDGVLLSGSLDLSNCQMLGRLEIKCCTPLWEIEDFSKLGSTWEHISIDEGSLLEKLPNLSTMKRLKTLKLKSCRKLREIKGLDVLTSFKELDIWFCPLLKKNELHPDLLTSERLIIREI